MLILNVSRRTVCGRPERSDYFFIGGSVPALMLADAALYDLVQKIRWFRTPLIF
jgi:hypothetical protein